MNNAPEKIVPHRHPWPSCVQSVHNVRSHKSVINRMFIKQLCTGTISTSMAVHEPVIKCRPLGCPITADATLYEAVDRTTRERSCLHHKNDHIKLSQSVPLVLFPTEMEPRSLLLLHLFPFPYPFIVESEILFYYYFIPHTSYKPLLLPLRKM